MRALKTRYYAGFFLTLTILVLAQVGWWAWNFLNEVKRVAELRAENLVLSSELAGSTVSPEKLLEIEGQASRLRFMFISESSFFALLTVWALYLLYQALRREAHSRNLEKSFIQAVSHEAKTPLTALKLRLEDVRDQIQSAPEIRSEIEGSLEEVRRLTGAFERMLTLNRTERESLFLQPVKFEVVVESVVQRLSPFLKRHRAEVSFQSLPTAEVQGDSTGLATSVQCLLENSVLHNTSDKPHIWIELRSEPGVKDDYWVLGIRDNGPGVPPEERAKIFEKFSRGARAHVVAGSGLGLYIARKIAEAHHGSLKLTESSERGSFFELSIPAVQV